MEIRFVMRIDEKLKIKAYRRVYMYHTNKILVMGFDAYAGQPDMVLVLLLVKLHLCCTLAMPKIQTNIK
jgi:hypothetical protein